MANARITPAQARKAARMFGRQGGKIGGAKGGKARAKAMTPEERSAAARKAVQARWAKAKVKRG